MPTSKTRRTLHVNPRVKLWFESGGEPVLCRGLRDILQAVEDEGSIKDAAAAVGRSYRFVWGRIKEAEAALGATLVEAHVGGSGTQRSELTPLALGLLRDFDEMTREVHRLVDDMIRDRLRETLERHGIRG